MSKDKSNLKLEKLNARLADLENKWKRAVADYQNLEKRIDREKNDFVKFAAANLLGKFLTTIDDLERANSHLKDQGLSLIISHFLDILKSEGVEPLESQNQKFDPQTMEAVEMVAGPQDTVVEVVLPGYLLNDKILRPAKVKVGTGINKK